MWCDWRRFPLLWLGFTILSNTFVGADHLVFTQKRMGLPRCEIGSKATASTSSFTVARMGDKMLIFLELLDSLGTHWPSPDTKGPHKWFVTNFTFCKQHHSFSKNNDEDFITSLRVSMGYYSLRWSLSSQHNNLSNKRLSLFS